MGKAVWKDSLTNKASSFMAPSWVDFCVDSYVYFIFWTITASIQPTIFWFSVWSMGLGGEEALLLFNVLGPLLLYIGPLRRYSFRVQHSSI